MARARTEHVDLPAMIARAITDIAQQTQRSQAFIVLRALTAAPAESVAQVTGDLVVLALSTGEDDPANMTARIRTACGKRDLAAAICGSWAVSSEKFQRWGAREAAAREAEVADDLDAELRKAGDPATDAATLGMLGASAYPRVRALVAAHPKTDEATLARLRRDREPYVRDAVDNR